MSKNTMIALIHAKTSPFYDSVDSTFLTMPPSTTLALLACETERRCIEAGKTNISIDTFDNPVDDDMFIRFISRADIVGFSTWFSNYDTSLNLANMIRKVNPSAKIVFGGPEASNLCRPPIDSSSDSAKQRNRILRNQKVVDYVVSGDGEDVLWRLACHEKESNIPNLWYRTKSNELKYSYSQQVELNDIGLFDFKHLVSSDRQLKKRDTRQLNFIDSPFDFPVTTSFLRGCRRAYEKNIRCKYCSIFQKGVRKTDPEKAWKQIDILKSTYGLTSFFESGDDLAINNYAEELLKYRPHHLSNVRFRCYSSFHSLTPSKCNVFKKLGIWEVFLGLDTTDKKVSKWSEHDVTEELVLEKLELLHQHGISVCLPWLFGMPYESADSLHQAEGLAISIVKRFSNIRMILLSLGVPLVGSGWFEELLSHSKIRQDYLKIEGRDLTTVDTINYKLLSRLSIKHLCNDISMDEIGRTITRIKVLAEKKIAVGTYGALYEGIASSMHIP